MIKLLVVSFIEDKTGNIILIFYLKNIILEKHTNTRNIWRRVSTALLIKQNKKKHCTLLFAVKPFFYDPIYWNRYSILCDLSVSNFAKILINSEIFVYSTTPKY